MIYLLTEIWLTPGGISTVHIYAQIIHRTTQLTTLFGRLSGIRNKSVQTNREKCGPCPVFTSYTLAFALRLRKRAPKTSVRVAEECQLTRAKSSASWHCRNLYKHFLCKWCCTKTVAGRATVWRTWNTQVIELGSSINHMELNRSSNHLSELSLKCQW
jgi:hypothetical protein